MNRPLELEVSCLMKGGNYTQFVSDAGKGGNE